MTGPRAGLTRRGLLASAAVLGVALPDVAQPGAARAETPKLFVFANSDRYDTLDPHQSFDVARVAVRLNLYDNLYRWKITHPSSSLGWQKVMHHLSRWPDLHVQAA